MDGFLNIVLSDYAIIIYELLGIIVGIIVGNIFSNRTKIIKTEIQQKEYGRIYSELDEAIGNSRRR